MESLVLNAKEHYVKLKEKFLKEFNKQDTYEQIMMIIFIPVGLIIALVVWFNFFIPVTIVFTIVGLLTWLYHVLDNRNTRLKREQHAEREALFKAEMRKIDEETRMAYKRQEERRKKSKDREAKGLPVDVNNLPKVERVEHFATSLVFNNYKDDDAMGSSVIGRDGRRT